MSDSPPSSSHAPSGAASEPTGRSAADAARADTGRADTGGIDDETEEMARGAGDRLPTGELPAIKRSGDERPRRIRPVRLGIKMVAFALLAYLLVGLLPDFRNALDRIRDVNPFLVGLGFALQLLALFFYSLLTRAALGEAARPLSIMRIFRIQLSTRALTSVVPGGNAAGSALGYRLLTLSGVSGPEAGFALATAGIGSAVVLNFVFWLGLIVSVPRRGVNPYYGTAALIGIIVIGIAAFLVLGLMEGQGRAERAVRWLAVKVRLDPDRMAVALREIGERLDELVTNRSLLKKVVLYAVLNWLVDAASLWVFIRAFGESLDVDALIVAFGLANLLAAIPITPGGLGYVDASYGLTLVGFGLKSSTVRLAVPAYRSAQLFFPILIGVLAYLSLRVGPWKIERRDRLQRLRDLARSEQTRDETRLDFVLRFTPGAWRTNGDVRPSDRDSDDGEGDDGESDDRGAGDRPAGRAAGVNSGDDDRDADDRAAGSEGGAPSDGRS